MVSTGEVSHLNPRDQILRPHRHRPHEMGHALEAGPQRFAITFADRFPAAETY
jgi:hypothetical protein